MQHNTPRMYLPRPDGTRDVFCEMSTARKFACTGYVKLNADNVLISGHIVYSDTSAPRYLCSLKCLGRYVTRTREFMVKNYGTKP